MQTGPQDVALYISGTLFEKGNQTLAAVGKFDFNSIMHLPVGSFSYKRVTKGKIQISDRWNYACEKYNYGCLLGQKLGLSKSDAEAVNNLFKCPKKSPSDLKSCPEYQSGGITVESARKRLDEFL